MALLATLRQAKVHLGETDLMYKLEPEFLLGVA
jgi:hypothetical protein